jgi:hypothetical protein
METNQSWSEYKPKEFALAQMNTKQEEQLIVRSILRVLRGYDSQIKMSESLGYNFNIYGKWETSKKILMWDDFLQILKSRGILINSTIESIYKISDRTKKYEAPTIISHFFTFTRT